MGGIAQQGHASLHQALQEPSNLAESLLSCKRSRKVACNWGSAFSASTNALKF